MNFKSNESGSASMEFVLWLPFIFFFILIAADATLAFMRQSQMWQVSRETARIVSRHGMTETAAETFAAQQATIGSTAPQVDVSFANSGGDVIVTMSMPVQVMAPFGVLNFLSETHITTRVTHTMEPLS